MTPKSKRREYRAKDILQFRHFRPIDCVWAQIRDFNKIRTWHPAFRESSIEGGRSGMPSAVSGAHA